MPHFFLKFCVWSGERVKVCWLRGKTTATLESELDCLDLNTVSVTFQPWYIDKSVNLLNVSNPICKMQVGGWRLENVYKIAQILTSVRYLKDGLYYQCGSSGFKIFPQNFPAEGGIWFSSLWMWAWLSDSLLMNRMQQVDAVWPPRLHSKEDTMFAVSCHVVRMFKHWTDEIENLFIHFLSLQGTCTLWEQGSTWSCSPPVFLHIGVKVKQQNCGPNHMIFPLKMMNWPLFPCRTDYTIPTWLTCLHVWLSPTYPSRSKLPSVWLTSWQQPPSSGSQATDSQPHSHCHAGTLTDVPPPPSTLPWLILVNYSSSTITCSTKCPFPSQQTDLAFSIIILIPGTIYGNYELSYQQFI